MDQAIMKARIIWGSMAGSVVLYSVVAEVVARNPSLQGTRPMSRSSIGIAIACVAGLLLAAAYGARRAILGGKLLNLRTSGGFAPPVARLFSAAVFSSLLCEMAGVAGLAAFLLAGGRTLFYSILAASSAGILLCFPSRSAWEQYAAEHVND